MCSSIDIDETIYTQSINVRRCTVAALNKSMKLSRSAGIDFAKGFQLIHSLDSLGESDGAFKCSICQILILILIFIFIFICIFRARWRVAFIAAAIFMRFWLIPGHSMESPDPWRESSGLFTKIFRDWSQLLNACCCVVAVATFSLLTY